MGDAPHFYEFGPFRLDAQRHILLRENAIVALTPKALETLMVLVCNHGYLVEKEHLLKSVWPDTFVEEATLAQNIFTLRKLLGSKEGSVHEYIQVVPKRGYRFVVPVTEIFGQTGSPKNQAETPRQSANEDSEVARWQTRDGCKSLAILPILDAKVDAGAEHLITGLAESVVNRLCSLAELQIKACSTLERYHRPGVDPQEVGRELGVGAILIGRILQAGDDITIRFELVDVTAGWQLWGQQYIEKITNVLSAQEAIANDIAEKLRLHLSRSEPED
jgi:DNA-binding winged helix-turn-helix (wHTH) protein